MKGGRIMKNKNCLLVVIMVGICLLSYPPVVSAVGQKTTASGKKRILFKSKPVLLTAKFNNDELAKTLGLNVQDLRASVRKKLTSSGVGVLAAREVVELGGPHYWVEMNVIVSKIANTQLYAYYFHCNIWRPVLTESRLKKTDYVRLEQIKEANILTATKKDLPAAIKKTVLSHTDAIRKVVFRPLPKVLPADVNDVTKIRVVADLQRGPDKAAKPAVAEYKYVASKKSKVFHKPDCPFAKRIAANNLVGYKSRAEAIEAGKKPCSRCKP